MIQNNISIFQKIDTVSTAYVCKCGYGYITKSSDFKCLSLCPKCRNCTFSESYIYREENNIEDKQNYLKTEHKIYSYVINIKTLKLITHILTQTIFISKSNGKVYFSQHHKNFKEIKEISEERYLPVVRHVEVYLNKSIWRFSRIFIFPSLDSSLICKLDFHNLPPSLLIKKIDSKKDFFKCLCNEHKGKKRLMKHYFELLYSHDDAMDQFENYIHLGYSFVLCKYFKNYDHLINILKNDKFILSFYHPVLLSGFSICDFELFFKFLLRNYTEKELSNLFSSNLTGDQEVLLSDSIHMIKKIKTNKKYLLRKKLTKKQSLLKNTHDYILRCYNKIDLENTVFEYSFKYRQLERKINNFKFTLAKDSKQLRRWGEELHHCVGFYTERIEDKSSLIVGIYVNSKIKYCLEIKRDLYTLTFKKIVQCRGKYNNFPIDEDLSKIKLWSELNNLVYVEEKLLEF